MYSIGDVDQAIAQQDSVMNAIDAQSSVLQPTDATAWAGQMNGWNAVKTQWDFDKEESNVTNLYIPALNDASHIMGEVQAYQQQSAKYGALVTKGGGTAPVQPNVNPGPAKPPINPDTPSTWPTWAWWAVGAAAVGAGLFVLDKVTDLVTGE